MNIGVNSNNECGQSLKEILQNIKNSGINECMLAFKNGLYEQMVSEAKGLGLKIPYVHLNGECSNYLWSKGPKNIDYIKDVKFQLDVCAKNNIPIAVMHATKGDASVVALKPSQFALECMNEIVAYAEKVKVKIALENLDKPNYPQFEFLLDNIKSDYLGFCYDAGHHNLYYPEIALLKKYGSRLLAVHLHDNLMDWKDGYDYTSDVHFLPYDGKIDYDLICEKLKKLHYKNVVMLEVHKSSWGIAYLYNNMTNEEFLAKAKTVAETLLKKIK